MDNTCTYRICWCETSDFHWNPLGPCKDWMYWYTNLIDMCEYPKCWVLLSKIQFFFHAIENFMVCQGAHEWEKGRVTYVLLLDRAWLHERMLSTHRKQPKIKKTKQGHSVIGYCASQCPSMMASSVADVVLSTWYLTNVQFSKCGHKHH